MDHLSEQDRSTLMAKIKGKNTKPELEVRRLIWSAGYRYLLHVKKLPGSPDIVFTSRKKAIFINGCFWHAHECRKNPIPKTRQEFWINKFQRNKRRDNETVDKLKTLGWSILVIWECEVKKADISDHCCPIKAKKLTGRPKAARFFILLSYHTQKVCLKVQHFPDSRYSHN